MVKEASLASRVGLLVFVPRASVGPVDTDARVGAARALAILWAYSEGPFDRETEVHLFEH